MELEHSVGSRFHKAMVFIGFFKKLTITTDIHSVEALLNRTYWIRLL